MSIRTSTITPEDKDDLNRYREAYQEYQADPDTISHAAFKKELGM